MPGVLIIEAMAQTGGLLIFSQLDDKSSNGKLAYFTSIDKAKFRKPIIPGDQLFLEVELIDRRKNIFKFKGKAYKNSIHGELAAEAEIMTAVT